MVQESSLKFFGQCFMAGCYIGFGAELAVAISAAMPGITDENPGLKKLIFAYLFPVNLVLITLAGGVLYTGTAVATPAAFFEKKASFLDVLRCLALSWVGNLLGSLFFAGFILWCDLLGEKTQHSFLSIAESKTSKRFDVTFAKGIGCNWMRWWPSTCPFRPLLCWDSSTLQQTSTYLGCQSRSGTCPSGTSY